VWRSLRESFGYRSVLAEDHCRGLFEAYVDGAHLPRWAASTVDHRLQDAYCHDPAYSPYAAGHVHCHAGAPAHRGVLEYLDAALRLYGDGPSAELMYAQGLFIDPHEASGQVPRAMDGDIAGALEGWLAAGRLDNTVTVLVADHGPRYGAVAGSLSRDENKTPLLALLVPRWFLRRHPNAAVALWQNQHRVTTPLDLHLTLLHFPRFPAPPPAGAAAVPRRVQSASLLAPVRGNRTCADAGVQPWRCPCDAWTELPVDAPLAAELAWAALDAMLAAVECGTSVCGPLTLGRITSFERLDQFVDANSDAGGTVPYYRVHYSVPELGDAAFQIVARAPDAVGGAAWRPDAAAAGVPAVPRAPCGRQPRLAVTLQGLVERLTPFDATGLALGQCTRNTPLPLAFCACR
jgi:hypothetical protein